MMQVNRYQQQMDWVPLDLFPRNTFKQWHHADLQQANESILPTPTEVEIQAALRRACKGLIILPSQLYAVLAAEDYSEFCENPELARAFATSVNRRQFL